jgi:arsenate reductase
VVTLGCGNACPVVPATRDIDRELDDPGDLPLEEVRRIRDSMIASPSLVAELDRC